MPSERENPEDQVEKENSVPEPEAELEAGGSSEDSPVDETVKVEPETPKEPSAEERLLYLRAEFENQKKRLFKEQEQAIRNANEKFVRELLTIVDLFDRAMASAGPLKESGQVEIKNFLVGIEMTHREMVNLLARFGVELVGVVGELFNPERHEAISQADTDAENVGKVVQVVQRGCLLNGRLIEPAKVIVGKAKEAG